MKNALIRKIYKIVSGGLCLALLSLSSCSPDGMCQAAAEPVPSVYSRIKVLEITQINGDWFTIFRDKDTGRSYVYIDGNQSGCVIELREKQVDLSSK